MGIIVPTAWWQGLVLAATVLSALLLIVGFRRGLLLGFAIDAVLAWVVLATAWSPGRPAGVGWLW